MNHKHHIDGRTVRWETPLFLRQNPHVLAILTEAASDDLQQYLADVRYQRDASVVAALRMSDLEDYWPCAGGLSVVIAIGTKLRDLINSGLTRWRMAV